MYVKVAEKCTPTIKVLHKPCNSVAENVVKS